MPQFHPAPAHADTGSRFACRPACKGLLCTTQAFPLLFCFVRSSSVHLSDMRLKRLVKLIRVLGQRLSYSVTVNGLDVVSGRVMNCHVWFAVSAIRRTV